MDWDGDTLEFHEGENHHELTLTRSGQANWSLNLKVTGGTGGLSLAMWCEPIFYQSCMYLFTICEHYKVGEWMNGRIHCVGGEGVLRWMRQVDTVVPRGQVIPQASTTESGLLVLTERYREWTQDAGRFDATPIFDALLLSHEDGQTLKEWPVFPRNHDYGVTNHARLQRGEDGVFRLKMWCKTSERHEWSIRLGRF